MRSGVARDARRWASIWALFLSSVVLFPPLPSRRCHWRLCPSSIMACGLQKLFSVEADFEDEDFLLALKDVEKDVEKQTLNPTPANLRSLRPVSAGLRPPSNGHALAKDSHSLCPSVTTSPVLTIQNCSRFRSEEGSSSVEVKSNQRSPLVTSFNVQRDQTISPSCTSDARFRFVKRQAAVLPTGSAHNDREAENKCVLSACMDFEDSLWSHPGSFRSDCGSQEQISGNCVTTAKKPRVANPVMPSTSISTGMSELIRTQGQTSADVINHLQPVEASSKLTLRPAAVGSCMVRSNLRMSSNTDIPLNSSCHILKPLGKPAECNSPSLSLVRPCSSFLSGNTPPGQSKSWIPNQNCTGPRMTNTGAQLLTAYGSPTTSVENTPASLKITSSGVSAGSLQTPVVTNHLVRLVTAANQSPQPMTHIALRAKTRRFPGPAGILPHQPDEKNLEDILVTTPQMPTHGALAKLQIEEVPASQHRTEDEFERGPWAAMKTELGLDERDPSCFLRTYSIVMVLRKAALKQLPKNKVPNMAVIIKTLTRTNVDAGAVFKDHTGEMQGTIHRLLLEEKESEFKAGSVLLLKQVGVFSPSHRNHYLNVTPSNLVKIYSPGINNCKAPLSQDIKKAMEMVQPQAETECQQDQPQNALTPMTRRKCSSGERCENNENSSQSAPVKQSLLTPVSGICGTSKMVLNEPSAKADGADPDDLDQLLGELPDDFFSSLDA
ncbi:homologous recombination OB-fold protein [Anolis sagrei]|uniref:homologous recombination OB-fold protein n=1 Tax=Anolis sagrei TaxID=38937 RepID=UPI0035220598